MREKGGRERGGEGGKGRKVQAKKNYKTGREAMVPGKEELSRGKATSRVEKAGEMESIPEGRGGE